MLHFCAKILLFGIKIVDLLCASIHWWRQQTRNWSTKWVFEEGSVWVCEWDSWGELSQSYHINTKNDPTIQSINREEERRKRERRLKKLWIIYPSRVLSWSISLTIEGPIFTASSKNDGEERNKYEDVWMIKHTGKRERERWFDALLYLFHILSLQLPLQRY